MHVISHFFLGWIVATADHLDQRERAMVTIAGVIPDIDGIGIIAELLTWNSNHVLWWYHDYHHLLAHNLAFGMIMAGICFWRATRRWKTATLAFLSFHLHLFADLAGSAGSDGYSWPISYFYPFSNFKLNWEGQWALASWQNTTITVIALIITGYIAWKRGISPLEMISSRANTIFVKTIRNRFSLTDIP